MADAITNDDWDGWTAMRVGRKLGRTLYLITASHPDEDRLVGVVDTEDLAKEIVRRWNKDGPGDRRS